MGATDQLCPMEHEVMLHLHKPDAAVMHARPGYGVLAEQWPLLLAPAPAPCPHTFNRCCELAQGLLQRVHAGSQVALLVLPTFPNAC